MLRKVLFAFFAILFAVMLPVMWNNLLAQAMENKPQVEVQGEVTAGYTTTVVVHTPYVYSDLYFNTNNGVREFPANCTQNAVGGIICLVGEKFTFIVEISPVDAHELWILARTSFGGVIADTELIIPVKVDDYFQIRPGEVSEYLYYLANDSLGGDWHSTGILETNPPITYTLPTPGGIQFLSPITGSHLLTYFVDTPTGRQLGNIYLDVTPEAPASRFPVLVDDHFEMEEGATSVFNLLSNDRLPGDHSFGFGIDDVEVDVEYAVPTIGGLQVISPVTGIYTFTYYVDVIGIERDTAEVVVHVRPIDVGIPPEIPGDDEEEMPGLHLEYFLPFLER